MATVPAAAASTAPVSASERMDVLDAGALTNYLMHSVAGVAIFNGIGLGYWARVPLVFVLVGAVAFFVVQMLLSRAWLSVASFGPAEWLWRSFTYGRVVRLFR